MRPRTLRSLLVLGAVSLVVAGLLATAQLPAGAQAAAANLSITKTDSPDPVFEEQQITYTVTAKNNGPDPADNVSITDNLSSLVQFVSAANCTYDGPTHTVTCSLGTLANGAEVARTIVVKAVQNGTAENTASVSSSTPEPSPDPNPNAITITTTINPSADLRIEKTDNPDPVQPGKTLTYSVTVVNHDLDDVAANVVVTDALPPSVTFNSVSQTQGTCEHQTGGTVRCQLGNVNPNGATATVTIVVTPNQPREIANTVSVSSTTNDHVPANNNDTEKTIVGRAPGGGSGPPECTVVGTAGPDVMLGTPGQDFLCGGDGNDRLLGLAGNDLLEGGAGNDILEGGEGVDAITYQNAPGAVSADLKLGRVTGQGASTDTVTGIESIIGSDFDDRLTGDGSRNRLDGLDGNDELRGFGGPDRLSGDQGKDNILGGGDVDVGRGGPGADVLSGGGGEDDLAAEEGKDVVRGGNGDDELRGGDSSDLLVGQGGDDFIDGGQGNDACRPGPGANVVKSCER